MLVGHYLLLYLFPCSGAVFIFGADYLMDGLVYMHLVGGTYLNTGLVKDALHMTEITGRGNTPI